MPPRRPAPTGDLLLGPDYVNSRGGLYIGELDPRLAKHGTYAALRVIEQDVAAFEHWLDSVAQRLADSFPPDPRDEDAERVGWARRREVAAAKLMGRWRNGAPLALNPDPPGIENGALRADERNKVELDAFDYAADPPGLDDREGRRCPIGAHVRRVNPRGGMVLGVPWGRHVVRRGMPYGPRWEPGQAADGRERGLVGLFLCADLEAQFEFIQHVWANEDLSAPGLRHTQDPIAGARDQPTPFTFRPRENDAELTVMVPPLTRTRASLYLFMPGIEGLRWLAGAGWAK